MLVNIHQAKTQFSRLVERAEKGEEIVIGRAGKPVARLVAYQPTVERRKPGVWRGKVRLGPDFDETPAELVEMFEG